MHYTLHLTERCNMRCRYCYVKQSPETMTAQTARAAVDLAVRGNERRLGLIFFGGEPLLCRGLIEETVAYAESRVTPDTKFFYKLTTNGLLLDDAFLAFAQQHGIYIALSLDGTREAHDRHRTAQDGSPTHGLVCDTARRLLQTHPYAPVLMTVCPDTVPLYAESVDFVYSLGFRYIVCSLDYAADWDKAALSQLKRQYTLLSEFYTEHTLAEDKFYFSPFDVKISSHIHSRTYHQERCELGRRQLSVSPDGGLYPCVQFAGDEPYRAGNVFDGIDEAKRQALFLRNEAEKPDCGGCAVKQPCNRHCACLNKQATGSMDTVSPVLCAHERIVLPIADRLAGKLYKQRSALFIQKHYNDFYPLVSLAEDRRTT